MPLWVSTMRSAGVRPIRGVFHDADINEDFREVSRNYIHMCHLRVNDYLPRRRQIPALRLLPLIQYDEYLTYSANFDRRICCDVSFAALKGAASRLGEKAHLYPGRHHEFAFAGWRCRRLLPKPCTIYHVPAEGGSSRRSANWNA